MHLILSKHLSSDSTVSSHKANVSSDVFFSETIDSFILKCCHYLKGKEEEEKQKNKQKAEDLDKMSKIDQNQNGIPNGGGQNNKIMIE